MMNSSNYDLLKFDEEYLANVDMKDFVFSYKTEIKKSVSNLQQTLVVLYAVQDTTNDLTKVSKRFELIHQIEQMLLDMMQSFQNNKAPKLLIRNLIWDNCEFEKTLNMKPIQEAKIVEIRFDNKRSRGKYCSIIFLLGKIHKMLLTNAICTKRELYYENCDIFSSQDQVDKALNSISCLLDSQLYELNVYASSKGLIYGPVDIIIGDEVINCLINGGVTIPYNICEVTDLKSEANFVLVVEKDAVFQKLIHDQILERLGPCIMVTGKGFPDINTRHLLSKFWNILNIPIFALVDADPWGIEIMCVYRFGSLGLSHQSENLAIPCMRWIGIHPSEISKVYGTDHQLVLTDRDKLKLQDLLERPYIKSEPGLIKEINSLLENNHKGEIEGVEESPAFLVNTYLRIKITGSDFL